jgi:hypothetical protein
MRKPGLFKRILRFVGWWFFAVGLVSLAVALGFALYRSVFLLRCVSTTGTIVRLEEVGDENNGGVNYAPVFSFTATDGRIHTIRSGTSSNPAEFDQGQVVRVLYVKSNPGGAILSSTLQLWFVTFVVSGLGTFYTGLGYLLLRFTRARRQIGDPANAAPPVLSS